MPKNCAAIVIAAKHGNLIKVKDYSGITDTVGALRCKFEFRTNDWDNASVTAVFCKGNMATHPEIIDNPKGVILDDEDECAVPLEVLTRDAKYFSVGIWGVTDTGLRIVSDWLVFGIKDGCYVDSTAPIEPTPTVYEQIMMSLNTKAPIDHTHDNYVSFNEIQNKQDTLVSGVNIKTINGEDILGSGNIEIKGDSSVIEIPENIETTDNKTNVIDENSAVEQYPTAQAVVNYAIAKSDIQNGIDFEKTEYGEFEVPSMNAFVSTLLQIGESFATEESVQKINDVLGELDNRLDEHETNQRNELHRLEANIQKNKDDLTTKQQILKSGENIKTINGQSILGSGDLSITGGGSGDSGEGLNILDKVDAGVSHLSKDIYNAPAINEAFTEMVTIFSEALDGKQEELVSGQNIKTINGQSILGDGNLVIGGNVEIPENVETTDKKVTTIDETSTDEQYPTAKAVYDYIDEVIGGIENGSY